MSWTEQDARQKKQRIAAADREAAERHRGFNLSAQDNHSKHERPHFAVLGEGSKTANANFRLGYEAIDWSK